MLPANVLFLSHFWAALELKPVLLGVYLGLEYSPAQCIAVVALSFSLLLIISFGRLDYSRARLLRCVGVISVRSGSQLLGRHLLCIA